MGKEEVLSDLITELRQGTIVLCILAKLKKPMYGYNLLHALADDGVFVKSDALYPLLRKMEDEGLIEGSWDTKGQKSRKYYVTTKLCREVTQQVKRHWDNTVTSVSALWEV